MASAAAPAGLCAPSSRTSRPSTSRSSSRPGQIAVAYPVRRAGRVHAGDPGRCQRVEERIGDGDVGRLVPTAQADPRAAETRQLDVDPVAIPAEQRRGLDLGERDAEAARAPPDDRQRVAARAGHGQVAAFDDRGLLARDRRDRRAEPVHVIEVDVGDDRHAAVPGVGRVEPAAETDLDEREVRSTSAKWANTTAVRSSNSVGWPCRRATRSETREDSVDEPREVVGVDRPAIDLDPLAVGDEVRLGRRADAVPGRPKRRIGQGQDTALAVRPGDEGAADAQLRVAERVEQGARPAKPQPDPEPAAVCRAPRAPRRRSGRPSGDVHRSTVTLGSALPRRRCTG